MGIFKNGKSGLKLLLRERAEDAKRELRQNCIR